MNHLKHLRESKGMSQGALANAAGVTRQTIGKLESGQGNPTHGVMQKIASTLGCSLDEIARPTQGEGIPKWTVRERQLHLQNIEQIVMQVGKDVIGYRKKVEDTTEIHGHASSTIDAHAQTTMVQIFTQVYDASLIDPKWVITLEFEDAAALLSGHGHFPTDEERNNAPVAIIDEIDGTTNVKRSVAAVLGTTRPKSAVCIALKCHPKSPIIECGAIYAFDEDVTFGGFFAQEEYIATRNGVMIRIGECRYSIGDSKQRIVVSNYSNSGHSSCGILMETLSNSVNSGKCECYGAGCRSSTIDIIDIIRNQYDAYVDCREMWTTDLKKNSVLRVYDVAAALPIARGAGLKVVRPTGEDFTLHGLRGHDPMSVIIGRPNVVDQVVEAMAPILKRIEKQRGDKNPTLVDGSETPASVAAVQV